MENTDSPERRIEGECFAGRVRILSRVATRIYDDALRPHGVRVSQMNVLAAVAARGPVPASQICRRLRLDKSTLSRDLDRLLERGWVRSTQGAGRARDLDATDSGRALIRAVLPAWDVAQERARRVLGAAVTGGDPRGGECPGGGVCRLRHFFLRPELHIQQIPRDDLETGECVMKRRYQSLLAVGLIVPASVFAVAAGGRPKGSADPSAGRRPEAPARSVRVQAIRGDGAVSESSYTGVVRARYEADQFQEVMAPERVKARSWLVEQEQPRLVEQRLGESDLLRHAAGKLPQALVGDVQQAELIEQRAETLLTPWPRHPEHRADVAEEATGGHVFRQGVVARQVAGQAPDGQAVADDVVSGYRGAARRSVAAAPGACAVSLSCRRRCAP